MFNERQINPVVVREIAIAEVALLLAEVEQKKSGDDDLASKIRESSRMLAKIVADAEKDED
jgi:hypothetical protein